MEAATKEAVKDQTQRFGAWWVVSLLALGWIMWASPENGSVLVYKLCMVTVGLLLAYWADRALMRNAPDLDLGMKRDSVSAARILARAIIAYAVINGLTGGI